MTTVSTHVLDVAAGRPAQGVRIELYCAGELVGAGETDGDGRIAELAETGPGIHRIVFHPPSSFFRRVELEIELEDGHYHLPLLISPYSCVSYRGS